MPKYTRTQACLKTMTANDTPQMRAVVNLVMSVEAGIPPDAQDLTVLVTAFRSVFGGQSPLKVFGHRLGFVCPAGRPADWGITPADVVSAVIEQELRRSGKGRNGLAAAITHVQNSFVQQLDPRSIRRDWENGRRTVQSLSDEDLEELLRPYRQ